MRIFLTGFMGSGKTFVGEQLAKLLQHPFIDLDDLIEKHSKKTIRQIFADEGEAYFRNLESAQLRTLQDHDTIVVATGGGTPCHDRNMEWMNLHGITIFLDVSETLLVERLAKERQHRPLLQHLDGVALRNYISAKRASRLDCYRSAMIIYEQKSDKENVAQHLFTHLPAVSGH